MPTWLLLVICVVCWGTWGVAQKLGSRHISPLMMQVVIAYVYSALAPLLFLYMKATAKPMSWNAAGIGWTAASCLLTAAASLSFATTVQRLPTHIVVGITSVYPVYTMVLCAVFLGEQVTLLKVMGIVTIVCGTVLLAL